METDEHRRILFALRRLRLNGSAQADRAPAREVPVRVAPERRVARVTPRPVDVTRGVPAVDRAVRAAPTLGGEVTAASTLGNVAARTFDDVARGASTFTDFARRAFTYGDIARGAPIFDNLSREGPVFDNRSPGGLALGNLVFGVPVPEPLFPRPPTLGRRVPTAEILIQMATSSTTGDRAACRVPAHDLRDGGAVLHRSAVDFVQSRQSDYDRFAPPGARPAQISFVTSTRVWRNGEECYYHEQFQRFTGPNSDPVQETRITTSSEAMDYSPAH